MSRIEMEHGLYETRLVLTPGMPGEWTTALVYPDIDGDTRVWIPMEGMQYEDADDLQCYEFSAKLPSASEAAALRGAITRVRALAMMLADQIREYALRATHVCPGQTLPPAVGLELLMKVMKIFDITTELSNEGSPR